MYRPQFDPADIAGRPRAQVRRVARLFVPYRGLIGSALLCVGAVAALGLIPPFLVKSLLDDAIPHRDGHLIDVLAVLMIVAPLAAGLITVLQTYLTTQVGQRVMRDLRMTLFARLLAMPMRWYTTARTGEVMSRLTADVSGVQSAVTDTFVSLVSNIAVLASTLVVMSLLSWRLTLVSVAVLPLLILPTRRVGLMTFAVRRRAQEELGAMAAHMQETLQVSGALLVKSFGAEEREQKVFADRNRRVMALQVRSAMIGRWFFMLIGLVGAAGPAVLYWVGGHQIIDGGLSLGTVVAFAAYLARLYGPVSTLAGVHVNVQGSLALFARLFEYAELEPDIAAPPEPVALEAVRGRVALEDVSFAYPAATAAGGATRWALRHVDVVAEPGQVVALVGPSGAGKTTLTSLVPRLWDVTEGRVTVDGVDVRACDPRALRTHIGIVAQESFLFHTTVAENLRYARPGASDEDLEAACRAANIHDLVASLPEGYATVVGERGHRFSGGEKQRLAIARVLLKDPRILILDEATSSLDSASERLVQEALARLMAGRTVLAVAHRLSTVLRADLIIVVDAGRVVERGTHTELIARDGLYAALYRLQLADDPTDGIEVTAAAAPSTFLRR